MPHFTESLDALRREAPARFLETDQFAEMLSTYHKLKPLSQSKPKSVAKQCAEDVYKRQTGTSAASRPFWSDRSRSPAHLMLTR